MFKNNTVKNKKGFTLIELMIVIAIISILSAIAIPQFTAYRIRSFNSAAISDLVNMQKTESAFFVDGGGYGYSATNATTPATLTGPGNINQGIANGTHFLQISLSNGVSLRTVVDGSRTTFNAATKHIQGNRAFAVDNDITTTYYLQDAITTAPTIPFDDAWAIPAVKGTNEYIALWTTL